MTPKSITSGFRTTGHLTGMQSFYQLIQVTLLQKVVLLTSFCLLQLSVIHAPPWTLLSPMRMCLQRSMPHFLVFLTLPITTSGPIVTRMHSSIRVLTSAEKLQIIKEKEQEKEAKLKEKEERARRREERRGL